MTRLLWDQPGDLKFENGVDRGVLYLSDRSGIAWNGLKSVGEDYSGTDLNPLYFDGLKYADVQNIDHFSAALSAITYPDEFLPFDGLASLGSGMYADLQTLPTFGLCYRTLISNDNTSDLGYKIHILYNLIAHPTANTYTSVSEDIDPMDFSWKLSSIPEDVNGYRPVSHAVFDTTEADPRLIKDLEDILYGTSTTAPRLPTLTETLDWVTNWNRIVVRDNGDGTATLTGPDSAFQQVSSTQYYIPFINGIVNGDTVTISDTDLP